MKKQNEYAFEKKMYEKFLQDEEIDFIQKNLDSE